MQIVMCKFDAEIKSYKDGETVRIYNNHYTGMFPVGDTSSGTLMPYVCVSVSQSFCPPTYRYIAPRMIQRIILKLCGYVGCDDATNVSNFGYEPIKFSSLKLIK